MEANNIVFANKIIDNNLATNTKDQYRSKVKNFDAWFRLKHPEFVNGDPPELNLHQIGNTKNGTEALKEFFGHISKKRNSDGTYKNPIEQQTLSHVGGYKSAIVDLFKKKRIKFSDDCISMQSEFVGGYKRLIAQEKQDGTRKMQEGKAPLTFNGYKFLAKKALTQSTDFYLAIFSHLFLLLCWNLIARCSSVSSLMFSHITWEGDAMVIVFPTSKGDQEGKDCSPKHVYANPSCPEICPILSLAIYVFCMGVRRKNARPTVFNDGVNATEDRFSKWLKAQCQRTSDILREMGLEVVEIGTHSFRKGVATFLSGMVGGASAISIYIRAGWSLGPVQSRYILEGGGGDHLCGRAATGLDITSTDFSALPPHFYHDDVSILTAAQWENILPGYRDFYPQAFRPVLSFLLASIIFHEEWLITTLPKEHPLFNTPLWTSLIIHRLRDKVLSGTGRHVVSKLTATGIPPHILLANEIAKLDKKVDDIKVSIMDKLSELPNEVKETMLKNFNINGTLPITRDQVADMLTRVEVSILAAVQNMQAAPSRNTQQLFEEQITAECAVYTWGGKLRRLPEKFIFPRDSISNVWTLWFRGKIVDGKRLTPYRCLQGYDFSSDTERNQFFKARSVMKFLIANCGMDEADISLAILTEQVTRLQTAFDKIYADWYKDDSPARLDRRSLSTMKCTTFYDLILGGGKCIRKEK